MAEKEKKHHKKIWLFLMLLIAASVVVVVVSFGVGYYDMGVIDVFKTLFGGTGDPNAWIILGIRFPRIISAYIIGAALSMSGAAYQGVLKNPLVSPDILGVASGAGTGAAVAIMLGLSALYIQLFAFAAGIIAVLFTYLIAKRVRFDSRVSLILSGTIVGSLAFALTTTLKYFADTANQLPEITYWLMGSLAKADMRAVLIALPFMAVGTVLLILMRWRMNLLTLSEIEVSTMGINPKTSMKLVIAGATLLCSAAVGLGGLIGWVGLMVPHVTRAITGPEYTRMLPGSAMIGGIFLVLMDDLVRSVSVFEIPIGLAIAFIGAPFFFMLIRRRKKEFAF